jgi:hypothetical protein
MKDSRPMSLRCEHGQGHRGRIKRRTLPVTGSTVKVCVQGRRQCGRTRLCWAELAEWNDEMSYFGTRVKRRKVSDLACGDHNHDCDGGSTARGGWFRWPICCVCNFLRANSANRRRNCGPTQILCPPAKTVHSHRFCGPTQILCPPAKTVHSHRFCGRAQNLSGSADFVPSRKNCTLTQILRTHAVSVPSRKNCTLTQILRTHADFVPSRKNCTLTQILRTHADSALPRRISAVAQN